MQKQTNPIIEEIKSSLTPTDLKVALHQGKWFRPDAGAYMDDREYLEWLRKNRVEIRRGSGVAVVMKARKQCRCKACPMPIYKNELYYSIQFGNGLGAIKTRDKVHIGCWEHYWEIRKERRLD